MFPKTPKIALKPFVLPSKNSVASIRAAFFTNGRFDVLAITEFPENITPSDICIAFARGGAVADIKTIPLLTAAQAIEAHSARSTSARHLPSQTSRSRHRRQLAQCRCPYLGAVSYRPLGPSPTTRSILSIERP